MTYFLPAKNSFNEHSFTMLSYPLLFFIDWSKIGCVWKALSLNFKVFTLFHHFLNWNQLLLFHRSVNSSISGGQIICRKYCRSLCVTVWLKFQWPVFFFSISSSDNCTHWPDDAIIVNWIYTSSKKCHHCCVAMFDRLWWNQISRSAIDENRRYDCTANHLNPVEIVNSVI